MKKAHVGVIPGIKEYLAEFTSESALGDSGYLSDKGLIPMNDKERKTVVMEAKGLAAMNLSGGH